MTHNSQHVIIHSLNDTVWTSATMPPYMPRIRVWHLVAACALVGFLVGLAF